MSHLWRRYLAPLAMMAAGLAGLLLWLRYAAPDFVRHAAGADPRRLESHGHATPAPVLKPITHALVLGLHVAAYSAGAPVLLAAAVAVMRLRARRRRARLDAAACAELRLGRDDRASPYEVSKVFDGIAGALRPGLIARALSGAPTLTLRVVSEGGARPVRFLIQAPALSQAAIAARLRATYPDVRLVPVDGRDADPIAIRTVDSPGASVRAVFERRERTLSSAVELLRVKKARRWVWALATTKDYEHSLIEGVVSVMHALPVPCAVELLLTPAPSSLERHTGHALRRRERRFLADRALGPNEPGAESVVAKKHLQGAVEGVGRAWWWFDLRVIVPRGHEPHARQVAGVLQECRGDNHLRVRVMRLRRGLYAWRSVRACRRCFRRCGPGRSRARRLPRCGTFPRCA